MDDPMIAGRRPVLDFFAQVSEAGAKLAPC